MAYKNHENELAFRRRNYLKNRERELQRFRAYRMKHHEALLQRGEKYRQVQSEQINERQRKYYHSHPEFRKTQIVKAQRAVEVRRKWFSELKRNLRCSICGQSFPDCPTIIDFHHGGMESKERGVSRMANLGREKKVILAEIAKCIPVCANCHRRLHYLEMQKKKKDVGKIHKP